MVRTVKDPRQLPLIVPESTWRPPAAPPSLAGARRIALDVETRDPDLTRLGPGVRRGAYMVGIAIAIEDGPRCYLPVRHEGGGNLDEAAVLGWARTELAAFAGEVVGANLIYDLDFLAEEGVHLTRATFRDVQLAEPLLDEYRTSYSLEALARERLREGKDETLLREAAEAYSIDPKSGLWRLPAGLVGAYAEGDVDLPLRLLRAQEREIEAQELREIFDLECALVPLFLAMKRRGIPVDEDRLAQAEAFFQGEERRAIAEIKRLSGVDLTGAIWSADHAGMALGARGVEVGATTTGRPSIQQGWLERLDEPVAKLLVRARKMSKARTTFAAQIRDHLVRGRIHPNYNQLKADREGGRGTKGTVTGRPSMDHPNLLFMPVRDEEIGPRFRSIFRPEFGTDWAKCDVSQQEPRLLVHFAHLINAPGAAEAVHRYRDDPATDYHQMIAELTGLARRTAKDVYLGTIYGMGGGKLCREYLNLPTETKTTRRGLTYEAAGEEGAKIMATMHERVPFLKKMDETAKRLAEKRGYVRTLLGRRCRFPLLDNGERDYVRKALNKLIQGSAADQTKAAMLAVWRELGIVPYLQVYDELDQAVPDRETAEAVARVMAGAVELAVPTRIDVETGPSWGELK